MKKTFIQFLVILFLFSHALPSHSQDVITLKTGDELKVKVLEILSDMVKYKKWENLEGPTYTSNKSEIFMIKYQNGTKDVFNTTQEENKPVPKTNDNTGKIIEIARPYMSQQISDESKGAIKLLDFKKQNGVQNDVYGQKTYTLEYDLIIEVQRGFYKKTEDKFLNANWYWGDFYVLDKGSNGGWDDYNNNWQHFDRGTIVEITGDLTFESTDNGWRVSGISMFSRGFKNKTSKILTNYIPPSTPVPSTTTTQQTKSTAQTQPPARDSIYDGDLIDGKKNGKGKMIYTNGSIYDGEWKDDQKNGKGKMTYSNGAYYEGEWKDDKKNGQGQNTYKDGSSYEGEV